MFLVNQIYPKLTAWLGIIKAARGDVTHILHSLPVDPLVDPRTTPRVLGIPVLPALYL